MENDLVIVERGREPKNGDIILAEVDGKWTMSIFVKKGKRSLWKRLTRNIRNYPQGRITHCRGDYGGRAEVP